jgi:hypothetical protein
MASNKQILKAYVRYDGTGRVIPGGPLLNRFKPKVGNWTEIVANVCCTDCPVLVYAEDFIWDMYYYDERTGEITFIFITAPGTSMQVAFFDCEGNIVESVNIPSDTTYTWTIDWDGIISTLCDLKFRRICTPGLVFSSWINSFSGDGPVN